MNQQTQAALRVVFTHEGPEFFHALAKGGGFGLSAQDSRIISDYLKLLRELKPECIASNLSPRQLDQLRRSSERAMISAGYMIEGA